MGFETKTTTQWDRRFCGRCGKAWGDAFTPDVEGAWSNVYATLATAMQSGSGTPPEAVAILAETI